MEGRCQCGTITFTTPTPQPSTLYICHCLECRHQSSSTYGMTAVFPFFAIAEPHAGALSTYTRSNADGETRGVFCTRCGSRLMHIPVSADGVVAPNVSVKAGCLTGLTREMMDGALHIWAKRAVVAIPEGARRWEEEPPGGSFSSGD